MSAEQKQEAVVKPLEWVPTGYTGFLDSMFYAVVDDLPFPACEPFTTHWGVEAGYGDEAGTFNAKLWSGNQCVKRIGPLPTPEAAFAAVQADHEARIRSALVAPAASSQERIAQLEAQVAEAVKVIERLTPGHRAPGCWCSYGRDIDRAGHEIGCDAARAFIAVGAAK